MKRALTAAPLLTVEQWADLDEDEPGELVDGILEEEEMPTYLHELVVAWLLVLLRAWSRARGGNAVASEAKLAIGPRRGRKPDLMVFVHERPKLRDSLVRVRPHLVVEVLSPRPRDARRDRVDKLGDYAAARAKYYWIVDPQVRTLEVYELGPRGRYAHALAAKDGRITRIPGCEGLELDLGALWGEIEAEAKAEMRGGRPPRKPRPRRG